MLFDVRERIALLNILPQEGDAVTLRILRTFQEELSFTEEEKAAIKISVKNDQFTWDASLAKPKEIEVGTTMNELIVGCLKQRDAKKRLHVEHLPLYERFVSPCLAEH